MEAFLLALVIIFAADPQWLGRHIAKTHQWYKFYSRYEFEDVHKKMVRFRAKNIKRIRQEKFKNK